MVIVGVLVTLCYTDFLSVCLSVCLSVFVSVVITINTGLMTSSRPCKSLNADKPAVRQFNGDKLTRPVRLLSV